MEKIHSPLSPAESAQLIARLAHGLLTGPVAVAFMRQSAIGGADLMAAPLLQTAEALAAEIVKKGFKLSAMTYKMAAEVPEEIMPTEELRDFFRQTRGAGDAK